MSAAALHEVQHAQLALIGSARAGRRTLLDMLLSAKGYEIAVCEDGPAVLEFLKENQPAIAIFDHDLPGMDGREICSRMRFITRLADTPIAIVTPAVEEMGGAAEFESFTDTTTADIVEAEPLGKKKLIERLENVIRDQKGAAFDGKVTIAMPTMAPPIADIEPPAAAAGDDGLDVFVDDDVDIEVDVARAIYSNDGNYEEAEARGPSPAPQPAAEPAPRVEEVAAGPEWQAEVTAPADVARAEAAAGAGAEEEAEVVAETATPVDEVVATADTPDSSQTADEFGEEMFLVEDSESAASGQTDDVDDIDLFTDAAEPVEAEAGGGEPEWLESLAADETLFSDAVEEDAHEEPEPEQESERELVGVAAEQDRAAHSAGEANVEIAAKDTLVELITETEVEVASEDDQTGLTAGSEPEGHGVSDQEIEPEAATEAAEAAEEGNRPVLIDQPTAVSNDSITLTTEQIADVPDRELAADGSDDEELTATIEAAIEAVNLAAMEEAEYLAQEDDAEQVVSHDAVESTTVATNVEVAEYDEIDVKSTVEMVVESAEPIAAQVHEPMPDAQVEAVEPMEAQAPQPVVETTVEAAEPVETEAAVEASEPQPEGSPEAAAQSEVPETETRNEVGANNYADDREDYRVESPSAEADGQEEGEAAVLNEERSNMQALIAEQAERIDNLQERNVQLRQELEQLKADAALRHEERSNLQALIKEQTEAITNLQQRNVQLRQELEQFKAEEAKRESERTFLQSHTSEQAETIAKLQQLNALLRQELEQRKADEAPLRDFLQRLLDRDEQNSAYQEAMRNEIISLTRENS